MSVHSMFKDGNLTITFNRPVVIPTIFDEAVKSGRSLRAERAFRTQDVIDLYVKSSIYDPDSEAIRIDDYYLTRINEKALDIQVMFKMPQKITEIFTEPDILGIKFKQTADFPAANQFVDQFDLDIDSEVFELDIVPQVSPLEMADLYG